MPFLLDSRSRIFRAFVTSSIVVCVWSHQKCTKVPPHPTTSNQLLRYLPANNNSFLFINADAFLAITDALTAVLMNNANRGMPDAQWGEYMNQIKFEQEEKLEQDFLFGQNERDASRHLRMSSTEWNVLDAQVMFREP
ncbi:hypothetical protein BDR26DRAFT_12608 [Obelidium mucronatum]|nr:hypothetical protein BDR26DRAFT_12608 [Obelidium mucronatum]